MRPTNIMHPDIISRYTWGIGPASTETKAYHKKAKRGTYQKIECIIKRASRNNQNIVLIISIQKHTIGVVQTSKKSFHYFD